MHVPLYVRARELTVASQLDSARPDYILTFSYKFPRRVRRRARSACMGPRAIYATPSLCGTPRYSCAPHGRDEGRGQLGPRPDALCALVRSAGVRVYVCEPVDGGEGGGGGVALSSFTHISSLDFLILLFHFILPPPPPPSPRPPPPATTILSSATKVKDLDSLLASDPPSRSPCL